MQWLVIRDHEGRLLTGISKRIHCCSPIEAEAQSGRFGGENDP